MDGRTDRRRLQECALTQLDVHQKSNKLDSTETNTNKEQEKISIQKVRSFVTELTPFPATESVTVKPNKSGTSRTGFIKQLAALVTELT